MLDWIDSIVTALGQHQLATEAFIKALADDGGPGYVFPKISKENTLFFDANQTPDQHLAKLLRQWTFFDQQPARETILLPGYFCIKPQTAQFLMQMNQSKLDFKKVLLNFRQYNRQREHHEELTSALDEVITTHQRPYDLELCLQKAGLARLHLKQMYRLCHALEEIPTSIAWTWAKQSRAISTITALDAEKKLLQKKDSPMIQQQLQKLTELHPQQKLAIVQSLAPHLRVNVTFSDKRRWMTKAALPLFVVTDHAVPIAFHPPGIKPEKGAVLKRRADCMIGEEPFLPSISAFLYYHQ